MVMKMPVSIPAPGMRGIGVPVGRTGALGVAAKDVVHAGVS
jgi:hypothetical protein